jgi:hypothetical protein
MRRGRTLTLEEAEILDKISPLQQVKGYDWGKDRTIVYVPPLGRFFRVSNTHLLELDKQDEKE